MNSTDPRLASIRARMKRTDYTGRRADIQTLLDIIDRHEAAIQEATSTLDELPGKYTIGTSNAGRVLSLWDEDLRAALRVGAP